MNKRFEVDMPTYTDKQFPAGDVSVRYIAQAQEIQSRLNAGDAEQQKNQLHTLTLMYVPRWAGRRGHAAVAGDLEYVAASWGNTLRNAQAGTALARLGIFATLAFAERSHILPGLYNNFSEELMDMSTYGPQAIQAFSEHAWAGMNRTHPGVASVLKPFASHLLQTYGIEPYQVEETNLVTAGAALPYVLATTTRMESYLDIQLRNNATEPHRVWRILENIEDAYNTHTRNS